MKLTEELKRMLNALAHAHAGENLTRRQKARTISTTAGVSSAPEATISEPVAAKPVAAKPNSQVGLYMGKEVSADIMQYVAQTCSRLHHGLTVLSFQPNDEVEAELTPYREMFDAAGIEVRVAILTGEPPAGLARALRRHPEIAFLVCNESGYFGHYVLNSTQQNGGMPVPVVLVASNESAAQRNVETTQQAVRAA